MPNCVCILKRSLEGPKNGKNARHKALAPFRGVSLSQSASVDAVAVCYHRARLCAKVFSGPDHAQWLLASVFFIVSPALIRLILVVAIIMNSGGTDGISFMDMILPSTILMLVMIMVYYYRFGSFRHPSFVLLMLTLASYFLAGWVGDNETLRSLAHVIFKS